MLFVIHTSKENSKQRFHRDYCSAEFFPFVPIHDVKQDCKRKDHDQKISSEAVQEIIQGKWSWKLRIMTWIQCYFSYDCVYFYDDYAFILLWYFLNVLGITMYSTYY